MKKQERLYCAELGAGERVVAFLPGLGATTRYWQTRVAPLTIERRLLLVDLLGFGRSSRPWTRYSIDRHVGAVHSVLGERGPLTLVGHSLGALISVAYAARYPSQVRALVLLSLPYFGDLERARAHFRHGPLPDRWIFNNLALAAVTCILTRRLFGRLLPRLRSDIPREVAEDLVQHTWRSSTSSLWEAVYRYDAAGDADRLDPTVPVRCLHGDLDPIAPLAGIRKLCAGRANWTLEVMPGVDHHPLLRDPQRCLRAIECITADDDARDGAAAMPPGCVS